MARTKQTARKSTGGKAPRAIARGNATPTFVQPAPLTQGRRKRQQQQQQPCVTGPEATTEQQAAALPTEITFTGTYDTAFYAYYFATGERETEQEVRCHYLLAHTRDPLLPDRPEDCWLGVSYNSKFDGSGMNISPTGKSNRPDLNLVVALDISGSMSLPFESTEEEEGTVQYGGSQTKLEVAKQCLLALLSKMRDGDAFGLVIFNDTASVVQPLVKYSDMNRVDVEKAITKLRARGGTQLSDGFQAATKLLSQAEEGPNRSSRVFFLTDMEITTDEEAKFVAMVKQNSDASIWSTIIGIGMDLARNTVEETSRTPGCNYATVTSNKDFREMMQHEFEYTVTPIGFNVSLSVESNVWQLHSGYGSPEVSSLQPGGVARQSTLFPSTQNEKGETRSGLFLFKLIQKEKGNIDAPFTILSKWDNLIGLEQKDMKQLQFKEGHVDNLSIRKAVLLIYYTDFIRPYIEVRNKALGLPSLPTQVAAPMPTRYLSLITPENRFKLLTDFMAYFKQEMEIIQDPALNDELIFLEAIHKLEQPFFATGEVTTSEDKKGKEKEGIEEDNERKRKLEEEEPTETKSSKEQDEETKRRKVDEDESKRTDPMTTDQDTGGQCIICWTEAKSVLFLPCKHLCSCKTCSDKTEECPLCRTAIQEKTQVFI